MKIQIIEVYRLALDVVECLSVSPRR